MDRKVFRLQQLPNDIDEHAAVSILSKAFGVNPSAIHIFSLALSVHPLRPSKVATLMFSDAQVQQILEESTRSNITKRDEKRDDEWVIKADGLEDPLVMDTHFRGLTPMHDPASHMADCIAISGLASHPMGSWQPKGRSKRFMWIRDSLPRSLPNVRPILYGYDTVLSHSNSFQSILDLAVGLVSQLKANGLMSPTSKPLAFLAHSLGGLVLKQAFLSLANRVGHQVIKGAIFFGVPNFGMRQSHFLALVGGQPNARLVADLAPESTYLRLLDEQFIGISYLQNTSLFWCYETNTTPILIKNSQGQWSQTGPRETLVTPESATRGLYRDASSFDTIFPIDEDHSSMVKFTENDPVFIVIADKLSQILFPRGMTLPSVNDTEVSSKLKEDTEDPKAMTGPPTAIPEGKQSHEAYEGETYEIISSSLSLRGADRDRRLDEIENQFRNTFDWIYDRREPGFSQWVAEGSGLFWINGKPGSGKSTLMKFLFKDQRTSDLLQDWKTGNNFTRVAFFFHYRGTPMQKSFEGLLRSVLSQIISERPELCRFLLAMFKHKSLSPEHWTLAMLQKGLYTILTQDEEPVHLCLFLDAIDEYDGHLESICKFLQDLGRIPSTPNRLIKVCFSSRPWDVFITHFKHYPSFSIQDYTVGDIRDYCLGSLVEERLSSNTLESVIPNLVERSRGVFLWVKLVVKDFAKNPNIRTMSKAELQALLDPYPTELDSYYVEIIERIPSSHRWKAYAMLEIAVRSKGLLNPEDFVCAVDCSESRTYQEATHAIERIRQQHIENFAMVVSRESKKYCGGLIEVVPSSSGYYIQVLHQTVEDFVLNPRFKQLILTDRAKITVENGNTFLAKYRLLRYSPYLAFNADDYARDAEKTSGRSLKVFLNSVPSNLFRSVDEEITTPLAYATYARLRLYIIESLADKSNLLSDLREPLLSYLIKPKFISMDEDLVQTARILLNNGFTIGQDPKAFGNLIMEMYHNTGYMDMRINDYSDNTFKALYIQLAKLLLDYGQDPDVDMTFITGDRSLECKPLHLCPSPLMEFLLDKGASVNTLSSENMTPLDHCYTNYVDTRGMTNHLPGTKYYDWNPGEITGYELYQMTCILLSRGGIFRKIPTKSIKFRLMEFDNLNLPTKDMRAQLFPPLGRSFMSKFGRVASRLKPRESAES